MGRNCVDATKALFKRVVRARSAAVIFFRTTRLWPATVAVFRVGRRVPAAPALPFVERAAGAFAARLAELVFVGTAFVEPAFATDLDPVLCEVAEVAPLFFLLAEALVWPKRTGLLRSCALKRPTASNTPRSAPTALRVLWPRPERSIKLACKSPLNFNLDQLPTSSNCLDDHLIHLHNPHANQSARTSWSQRSAPASLSSCFKEQIQGRNNKLMLLMACYYSKLCVVLGAIITPLDSTGANPSGYACAATRAVCAAPQHGSSSASSLYTFRRNPRPAG